MTQETVAQNIKNQLKSSTGNEKVEKRKRKTTHWQFYRDLKDHQQIKRSPWCGYVAQILGRNRQFNNSSPRSSTQYALP
jgi:hypothetical protein